MSQKSMTSTALSLVALAAGGYHGYCDAQGIPFQKENAELLLTYGPAILRGSVNGIKTGLFGLVTGGAAGAIVGSDISNNLRGVLVGAGVGTAVTATALGSVGFGLGAVKGGFQTLVGYGMGYLAGYITK